MERPICFVIMPYGKQLDSQLGTKIDFDRIYQEAIAPGVLDSGLEPVRSDLDKHGGVVHKGMFERILLCEYAIADLTTCNPNVMYELGIRHATRQRSTLPIFASHVRLPFNVGNVRGLPYRLREERLSGTPGFEDYEVFGKSEAQELRTALAGRLGELRQLVRDDPNAQDSPLFQILSEWRPQPIAREKTDTFRDRVVIDSGRKSLLEEIRRLPDVEARQRLDELATTWLENPDVESASFVDLFLSYRHVKAWREMVDLASRLPAYLNRQVLFREQVAFALNRIAEDLQVRDAAEATAKRDEARHILRDIEEHQGPSSETCGLLGRISKAEWGARASSDPVRASAELDEAIECYRRGALADLRDAYPAINLVTLLSIRDEAGDSSEVRQRMPVIEAALNSRTKPQQDYWDHATWLELSIIKEDAAAIKKHLGQSLRTARESWEPETTAKNLRFLSQARESRGVDNESLDACIAQLLDQANRLAKGKS